MNLHAPEPTRSPERRRPPAKRAWWGAALAAVLLVALVPGPGAGAAEGPALEISATSGLDPAGQTVTVTGSGYDPSANIGTRPPLAGQPAGVYVVFGRFAEQWRPSEGAPSGARQIVTQVWALPRAAYDLLNPLGTNPEIVLLQPDGSFTAEVAVREADGTGRYAIATYPGSGAVNAAQEVLVPVSFASPTTTTVPSPTTTVPGPTTTVPGPSTTTTAPTSTTVPSPTTTVPSTSTTTPAPTTTAPTTTVPAPGGTGSRTGVGPNGQRLTVAPADELDPAGATIRVTGSGYDTTVGVYVALCVDQGSGAAPSPCVGGVDMEGEGSSSAWISSDPPPYAGDLATPFGPGGSFDVRLTVAAADEHVDCLDESVRCVLATRADHTESSNRSADVRVPVNFRGRTPVDELPDEPRPTVSLSAPSAVAGGSVEVVGEGFMPGEQVQIWLHSDPVLLGVATAGAAGEVRQTVTIAAGVPAGQHRLELRGLTSGRTVSTPLTVLAGADTAQVADRSAGPGARLAFTGGNLAAAAAGATLLLAGAALVLITRTNRQGAHR